MIKTIEEELRAWLRPMSPLTAFAKGVKGEGETQKQDEKIASPFDFDWDELPTDVKARLEGAKKSYEETNAKLTETEKRRAAAEDFARKQQGQASKFRDVLVKHNLSPDGTTPPTDNSEDTKINARVERLVKGGMPEAQAKGYAKLLHDEAKQNEAEIMQRLGPLAANVGHLQANMALANARSRFSDVFAIPELAKEIETAAGYMLQNGNVPNEAAIQNLVEMAWGKHVLTNPDAINQGNKREMQQEIPKFGSGLKNGGHVQQQKSADGKAEAPRATQPETMSIMANVIQELNRGIPTKKGK